MRDHSNHIQLTREDAVTQILEASGFMTSGRTLQAENLPLFEAFGRVLARDVQAVSPSPNCLTCNMDSIAVRWSDFEELAPGELPDTSRWVRGVNWEFANTGIAMPEGFDTAIVIEHVEVSPDEQSVTIDAAPSRKGAGTRAAGSQIRQGDVLAHAGDIVSPDIAARIAGGNVASVALVTKPRVAFIPTGNELVPPGVPPIEPLQGSFAAYGKNFETNSLLARGKVEAWGGEFMAFDIVPDDPQLIREALAQACSMADIVVLNAGSSKGSDDWSCEVMEQMGKMICHQTNHGPGHHSSYALIDGVPVVGISGPSAGASFTLDFYLRPLMRAFLGLESNVARVPVKLAAAFPMGGPGGPGHGKRPHGAPLAGEERPMEKHESAPGKPAFFSIRLLDVQVGNDGVLLGTPIAGGPGSSAAATANAYYMLPSGPGVEPPKPGDVIWAELR